MDVKKRLIEMADGTYVEEDTLRIAQKIAEYDPNLRLKYCAAVGSPGDAPYRLVELCPDGVERIVFDIWELDDRVMDKLHEADNQRRDVQGLLDVANQQAKNEEVRRFRELKEEQDGIAEAIIKNNKSVFRFHNPITGDKVTVHENKPVEVESNER